MFQLFHQDIFMRKENGIGSTSSQCNYNNWSDLDLADVILKLVTPAFLEIRSDQMKDQLKIFLLSSFSFKWLSLIFLTFSYHYDIRFCILAAAKKHIFLECCSLFSPYFHIQLKIIIFFRMWKNKKKLLSMIKRVLHKMHLSVVL